MRALAISAIVLVAVIMVIGAVAPALQQAFAHDVTEPRGRLGIGGCPEGFQQVTITDGQHPDHNFNGFVCQQLIRQGVGVHITIIDDNAPPSIE